MRLKTAQVDNGLELSVLHYGFYMIFIARIITTSRQARKLP